MLSFVHKYNQLCVGWENNTPTLLGIAMNGCRKWMEEKFILQLFLSVPVMYELYESTVVSS